MKKHLSTIFLVAILILGMGILCYPMFSDYWNSFHQSRAIASYSESVAQLTAEDYDKLWAEAEAFNRTIPGRSNPLLLPESDREIYESLLDISGTGIMGYIEISKIGVSLPIYHGTSDAVLQIAVGHLDASSLPVGGASSHCVLSGHRGLPSAKLFTDLNKIVEGDTFVLRVLDETLTYQVDQIHIVEPTQMDDLRITEGEDYCTLVTCTPYGINSHRMLVRGRRIENEATQNTVHVTAEGLKIDPILVIPFVAAPILLLLLLGVVFLPGKKKR